MKRFAGIGLSFLFFLIPQDQPLRAQSPPVSEEFSQVVRSAEPRTPDQERNGFRLPDGFQIQLVACEPQIAKPINMAFDDAGRLWVTSSVEYPIAATQDDAPRDTIKILEDNDGDGFAETVTTFADGLNIPIGLYPYKEGVICFSIPNILHLKDTDGDGRADERNVLYGPFDTTRDTHGMCNAFTRGYDGWLYACHGFNNQSRVAGSDGHEIQMNSGNTFRMKLDGSRIEHFTHGQVNPFGMSFDSKGDLFTADCHTKPVTLLMRGGYSPSFGAPHDGLGFVPPVMQHLHGSTAIGGIAIYEADQFPKAFHGNAFGGNVMTGRINRNQIVRTGGSVQAQELADFLISDDPWFRPVDLKIGPDGALYVADFYNRIIGHYEVPLDHDGRDRFRGRIWKITYTGDERPQHSPPGLGNDSIESLIAEFGDTNRVRRMKAADQLVDHRGTSAIDPVRDHFANSNDPTARVHSMWVLHRLGALQPAELRAALEHDEPLLRTHAFRVIAERDYDLSNESNRWVAEAIAAGIADPDALVARAAAMSASVHQHAMLPESLLQRLKQTGQTDPHLRHALRLGLRNQLRREAILRAVIAEADEQSIREVVNVCLAIPQPAAATVVLDHLTLLGTSGPEQYEAIQYVARHIDPNSLSKFIAESRSIARGSLSREEALIRAAAEGSRWRGMSSPGDPWKRWVIDVIDRYLHVDADGNLPVAKRSSLVWSITGPAGRSLSIDSATAQPWQVSRRRQMHGSGVVVPLYSSYPAGESVTGRYRSEPFALPATFSFAMAGHDGPPDARGQGRNYVRLVSPIDGSEFARWPAPGNDVAQPIRWQSGSAEGSLARVEIVDGDPGNAFAWIAAGEFSVDPLNPDSTTDRICRAAGLASEFKITERRRLFGELLSRSKPGSAVNAPLAATLLAGDDSSVRRVFAKALGLANLSPELYRQLVQRFTSADSLSGDDHTTALGELMSTLPASQQQRFASELSSDAAGTEALADLVADGKLSASVLNDPSTRQQWQTVASSETLKILNEWSSSATPDDSKARETVSRLISHVAQSPGDPQRGRGLFQKQCAVCHQVGGVGAVVGPNLDGVGHRGIERLMEDVLLPNRNVDVAFRSSTILTDEGQVITGLVKPGDGEQIKIVTTEAKEISLSRNEIEQIRQSKLSPMPAGFTESLTKDQIADLFGFLLSLKQ